MLGGKKDGSFFDLNTNSEALEQAGEMEGPLSPASPMSPLSAAVLWDGTRESERSLDTAVGYPVASSAESYGSALSTALRHLPSRLPDDDPSIPRWMPFAFAVTSIRSPSNGEANMMDQLALATEQQLSLDSAYTTREQDLDLAHRSRQEDDLAAAVEEARIALASAELDCPSSLVVGEQQDIYRERLLEAQQEAGLGLAYDEDFPGPIPELVVPESADGHASRESAIYPMADTPEAIHRDLAVTHTLGLVGSITDEMIRDPLTRARTTRIMGAQSEGGIVDYRISVLAAIQIFQIEWMYGGYLADVPPPDFDSIIEDLEDSGSVLWVQDVHSYHEASAAINNLIQVRDAMLEAGDIGLFESVHSTVANIETHFITALSQVDPFELAAYLGGRLSVLTSRARGLVVHARLRRLLALHQGPYADIFTDVLVMLLEYTHEAAFPDISADDFEVFASATAN